MVALYLHVLPDEVRDKMSYVDYQDMIKEIGIKINYESISNVLGNSYADAGEMVSSANPLNYKEVKEMKPQRMTKEMAMKFMGQSPK